MSKMEKEERSSMMFQMSVGLDEGYISKGELVQAAHDSHVTAPAGLGAVDEIGE
jgi:hypothetical protein